MRNKILDLYEQWGWDLVPVARNQKNPIEEAWTSKTHKDKVEWERWVSDGLNIGVKTGICSNITVLDQDCPLDSLPEEIKNILLKCNTLKQHTSGYKMHYFFKYDKDIPKTRIDELKLDIENDGGQVVIYPSIVDNLKRKMDLDEILPMPQELKILLLFKIVSPNTKSLNEIIKEDIETENFNLGLINEGNRNSILLRLGGVLRKHLNINQTDLTLQLLNKTCCKPPLKIREVDNIVSSLKKYEGFDELELASKILNYFKIVEEASNRDIREAMGETKAEGKQKIDKAIKYLEKEGFLFKKRRIYHLIKRATWKDTLIDSGGIIKFKMPYFDDYAVFRNGDALVIGAKTGIGKTHLAMNIVKRLVQQGIHPFYLSLESGARFIDVALKLGLKDGDFRWAIHFSPTEIELEENAVTVIDWLLPDDYATTDKIFKYFVEQLVKKGGILIIFMQLKQDNNFFALNMVDLFPAFVTKFIYEDEYGVNSYFQITKIREPKERKKNFKILTTYDWSTRELTTREEKEESLTKEEK